MIIKTTRKDLEDSREVFLYLVIYINLFLKRLYRSLNGLLQHLEGVILKRWYNQI